MPWRHGRHRGLAMDALVPSVIMVGPWMQCTGFTDIITIGQWMLWGMDALVRRMSSLLGG